MMPHPSADEVCSHLMACEQRLLDPAVRRNRAHVSALLADDFEEFGASGRVWSREQILELLEEEEYQPPMMEAFQCRFLADSVALVTYRTVRTDPVSGTVSATLRSSIWVQESGTWRVRFHQGTRIP